MRKIFLPILLLVSACAVSQEPDRIYSATIHNVKLNYAGNQLAYPVIKLNSADQLELNFDDLDPSIRNYSYTWQLCNSDWTKTILSEFDYIKGFTQNRINTYRNSSIALVRYVHYSVNLPERNCIPSRSGNYLLKVFADGDTSNVKFTRRVLVIEEKATIGAQIQQPFNGQVFKTHQKLQFVVNLGNVNIMNALQQVRVCILQNNRWDNALCSLKPTFIRPGSLEFNTEDAVFPGGREWRWLDLRSFRLQSDRVETAKYNTNSTEVFVKPDLDRSPQRLVFYKDNNGMYYNDVSESINYLWQADYANVHFSFVPSGNQPLINKEVYLFGELTNYGADNTSKMSYNAARGVYETNLLLKQGYYNYCYVTMDNSDSRPSFEFTEGNFWDTENSYTILVYYRSIGGRSDELIGITHINSLTGRSGF